MNESETLYSLEIKSENGAFMLYENNELKASFTDIFDVARLLNGSRYVVDAMYTENVPYYTYIARKDR